MFQGLSSISYYTISILSSWEENKVTPNLVTPLDAHSNVIIPNMGTSNIPAQMTHVFEVRERIFVMLEMQAKPNFLSCLNLSKAFIIHSLLFKQYLVESHGCKNTRLFQFHYLSFQLFVFIEEDDYLECTLGSSFPKNDAMHLYGAFKGTFSFQNCLKLSCEEH
ncbi:hypothetical protein VNO77_19186 [Canavalia gladiata]|uniref:Uncharacterized protein n=1 Tax=Canavalia gladiata TaxID=3824 RepID=A0AAN9QL55_CANGL